MLNRNRGGGGWQRCHLLTGYSQKSIGMKDYVKRVRVNREMRGGGSYEGCMERIVSPAQREVFLIVDEFWKRYGFSPTVREIAYLRGKMGMKNTQRLVDRLVELGVLKKVRKLGRTIRPVYINFKNLE